MHRFVIVALVLFVAAGAAAAQELKTDQDKALYAIGLSMSERLGPFALTAGRARAHQGGPERRRARQAQARPARST